MSQFVDIAKIIEGKHDGESVSIRGWVYNKRSSGGIQFLMVRDGTGVIQCTLNKNNVDETFFNKVEKLPIESVLEATGLVNLEKRAPDGREVSIKSIGNIIESQPNFPITRKKHGVEFLLDNRHLYIRDPKMQTIFRLRAMMMRVAREWFNERGYTEAHSPIFTSAACEGGSTLFEVNYFEREGIYLSQSWQLYAEAMISSLGKIYTISPSFRAEESRTRRHIAEFWHLEVEEPFTDLDGIMKVGDELVTHICQQLAEKMPRELKRLGRDPKSLLKIEPPFPRITYDEASEILRGDGIEILWGDDFGWQQEEPLTKHFESPFWVTHFPIGIKAFYHKPDPKRPDVTLSGDLLAPEGYGEIIGGGQRIHDYDELLKRINDENLDPSNYSWYLDLRKWGTVPHSGFGLGIERVLMWICKLETIRDTIPFPRDIRRVYP
ncbi:asparagine--tRNA ligase [Candidatus Bathyarchaeota archaeon]|nr:asparagine--tRNA ligase [Candidatus Bathyarchaeota archaeon]MBS7630394.1 asparagine--tRNA ligase [Candidatus Bathyarchaeota archaeon]